MSVGGRIMLFLIHKTLQVLRSKVFIVSDFVILRISLYFDILICLVSDHEYKVCFETQAHGLLLFNSVFFLFHHIKSLTTCAFISVPDP